MRWHTVGGVRLPVLERKNASSLYNLRSPEAFGRGLEPRDYKEKPIGYSQYAAPFDQRLQIPREEWKERIQEQEAKRNGLFNVKWDANIPTLNQGRTNSCWAQCVINNMHTLRVAAGMPFVYLSPTSVSGPIKNYRNVGGWPTQAVEYIAKYGVATKETWPLNSLDSRHARNAQEDRRPFSIYSWFDLPRAFGAVASLALRNIPSSPGLGWWSHAVEYLQLVWLGGDQFGIVMANSHGNNYGVRGYAIFTEEVARPDGGSAPVSTTFTPAQDSAELPHYGIAV